MIPTAFRNFRIAVSPFCFWIVLVLILMAPFEYWAIVSWPDSTDYFLQEVDSAVVGPDGRRYIFVGDNLHVRAYNWRHLINGTCLLSVDRIRENVNGPFAGKRTLMQHVDQQFVGDGIIRRTSWPISPQQIRITSDWFDDHQATEQELDIYTTGTYDCNLLDRIRLALGIPRIHHDGEGHPWRERTRVVLRRERF